MALIYSQSSISLGSQDYTRANLDLDAIPELAGATVQILTPSGKSSPYSSQSWSGISWSNEVPATSSPVKECHSESDHESEEEDEEDDKPFVPYTQSSVVRPITRGYSESSDSYGSKDYTLDPAIIEILDRIERREAEAEGRVSSIEPIESFSPTPTPHPLVASYSSSPISSFSEQTTEIDSGNLGSQTPGATMKVTQGLSRLGSVSSLPKSSAVGCGEFTTSAGQHSQGCSQPFNSNRLSRSETYSSIDFGEGALNLINLSQHTLQTIDAIEASLRNNKRKDPESESATTKKQAKKPRVNFKSKKNSMDVDLEAESLALQCALCGKLLENPQISSSCGHTLGCNSCVVRWVMKRGSHPACYHEGCGTIVDSIVPNHALSQLIAKHVKLLHGRHVEWDQEKGKLRKV